MELGPENHNMNGLLGPNSILVVYMDPLGGGASSGVGFVGCPTVKKQSQTTLSTFFAEVRSSEGPSRVDPQKLETRLRTNSARIPFTLLLRIEAIGFPTFGLLLYTTMIMELGTKKPSLLWFGGPSSITVVHMDPLGSLCPYLA